MWYVDKSWQEDDVVIISAEYQQGSGQGVVPKFTML